MASTGDQAPGLSVVTDKEVIVDLSQARDTSRPRPTYAEFLRARRGSSVRSRRPLFYSFELPCEFAFIGCNLHFHQNEFEIWVAHSLSHFGANGPPPKSICVFCGRERFFDLMMPTRIGKRGWSTFANIFVMGHLSRSCGQTFG